MKRRLKILIVSILFGLLVWIVDAIVDYIFFYEGTFLSILITDVPDPEIFMRFLMFICFSLFGAVLSNIFAKRKKVGLEFKQLAHDLGERIKELNCLYELDQTLREEGKTIDELLTKIVNFIPASWQYPEITGACITFADKKYKTKNFKETLWMQKADISVNFIKEGSIKVCYLKEKPESDEGPFLKQERSLIDSIAERLGQIIEKHQRDEGTKNAEEKLKESEARYRTLFEASAEGILIADIKTKKFEFANPAICKMLGYTEKELKKMGVEELHPRENLQRVLSEFEAQARGKKSLAEDIPCLKKDGTILYADINTSKCFILGSECNMGFFRDVTEKKQERGVQASLYKISQATNLSDNLSNLFHSIHRIIMELMPAKNCFIALLDSSGESLEFPYFSDEYEEPLPPRKNGRGLTEYVIRIQKPILVTFKEFEKLKKMGEVEFIGDKTWQEWLGVPLIIKGNTLGALVIQSYPGDPQLGEREREILTFVSTQVAMAIERKRTEDEMLESEKRHRELVNTSVDAVISIDSEMKIILWNPAAEKIFGYTKEEIQGQSLMKVVPEKYKEAIKEGFSNFVKTGTGSILGKILELEGLRKDGTIIPIELSVSSRPEDGWHTATAIVRDVTARKNIEKKLKLEKAYIDQLFKSAPEAIVMADDRGRNIRINDDFTKLFGFTHDEVAGKYVDESIVPKSLMKECQSIREKVKKGESVSLETKRQHKDGTLFDVSVLASPVMAEGKLVGIYGIYRDITARKRTDAKLKASLKEKELLLKEIHHRVKNNLQVISSLLFLQSQHIKGKKNIEMFQESQNRVKSMALIHEKLYQSLDLARINFREYINSLVNGLFRSYRASLGQISLNLDIEDVALGIDNAIPCGLIINELVSNALKYAFPNEKEGEIKVGLRSLNKKDLELCVSDNGVGMPKDLDIKQTKSLGLHLVSILAEDQLHGEIKLNREKGTEFRITLRDVR